MRRRAFCTLRSVSTMALRLREDGRWTAISANVNHVKRHGIKKVIILYVTMKARVPSLPYGAFFVTHFSPERLISKNLFMERMQVTINITLTYIETRFLLKCVSYFIGLNTQNHRSMAKQATRRMETFPMANNKYLLLRSRQKTSPPAPWGTG